MERGIEMRRRGGDNDDEIVDVDRMDRPGHSGSSADGRGGNPGAVT
jgi:hypothetical protein